MFGLDPGPRLDALRERLSELLAFGDQPDQPRSADPDGWLAVRERFGPLARSSSDSATEVDRCIFELIDERRAAEDAERDDVLAMLLAARHEDGSPMSRRRSFATS